MNSSSDIRENLKAKIREFFITMSDKQWNALKTGCPDKNTMQSLGSITSSLIHISVTELMAMIKDCQGGVPGEVVNSGEAMLQGVGEKSEHCACCPHSCTHQLNQEGPKDAPVPEPTKDSKEKECDVCEAEPSAPSDDVTVEAPLSEEQLFVKELVNAVITRASREAKVSPSDDIQHRLFIALWAQLKEKTLNIKEKSIKRLQKAIFKDITKVLNITPNLVIIALCVAPPHQQIVISVFKQHLFRKKRNLLTRLLAWCGKTEDDEDQIPESRKISQTLLDEFENDIFPVPGGKSPSGVSGSSLEPDEKEHVSALIHSVLSHAAKTSRYKPSVKLHKQLVSSVLSDVNIKDLYIDEKKLKGLDKAIYLELRSKTFCKEQHLLMLLNDEDPKLQNLTINIIKKHLIESMQNPALSAAEDVQKYRSSVEICVEDLVKYVVENADSPCSSQKADAIAKQLFSKVWPRIKKIQIPPEHVIFLSNMVYNSLIEKWKDPDVILTFMALDHRYVYNRIIKVFREHAATISESQTFIGSFFSSVGRAVAFAHRQNNIVSNPEQSIRIA
ncbi:hypothetical protein ACER0C_014415 [Sarotherodon galilaeus]